MEHETSPSMDMISHAHCWKGLSFWGWLTKGEWEDILVKNGQGGLNRLPVGINSNSQCQYDTFRDMTNSLSVDIKSLCHSRRWVRGEVGCHRRC